MQNVRKCPENNQNNEFLNPHDEPTNQPTKRIKITKAFTIVIFRTSLMKCFTEL